MNQHCEPTVNTRTLHPLKLPARLSDTGDAELRRGLYVDCETTGLSFERDQAIEVAMLPFIETALALRTARPELPVAATLTPRSASPPTSPRHASPGCSSPATTTPRRRGRISTTTSSPTGATRSARASARRPGQAFTTEPHDNALSVHRRARLEGNARHRGQGRSGKENGVHRARAGTVRAALTHPPRTPRGDASMAIPLRRPRRCGHNTTRSQTMTDRTHHGPCLAFVCESASRAQGMRPRTERLHLVARVAALRAPDLAAALTAVGVPAPNARALAPQVDRALDRAALDADRACERNGVLS